MLILAPIGLSVSAAALILWLTRPGRSRPRFRPLRAPDAFVRWAAGAEENLKRAGFRISGSRYAAIAAASGLLAFALAVYLFRNITAAVLMAGTAALVPDQVLSHRARRRQETIMDQMAAAIRIFTAEFLQTPQVERGIYAVAARVPDPVGRIFRDAYQEMTAGFRTEAVLSRMAARMDFEYGRMFMQLVAQATKDASVAPLFGELVAKIEEYLELRRKSYAELAGERLLAGVMMAAPLPAYLFMRSLVPETTEFLVYNFWGRLAVVGVFLSMLVWAALDRVLGRVEG